MDKNSLMGIDYKNQTAQVLASHKNCDFIQYSTQLCERYQVVMTDGEEYPELEQIMLDTNQFDVASRYWVEEVLDGIEEEQTSDSVKQYSQGGPIVNKGDAWIMDYTSVECKMRHGSSLLIAFRDYSTGKIVATCGGSLSNTREEIAQAFRNAVLEMGCFPKTIYKDDGKGFHPDSINDMLTSLGIKVIHVKPYNHKRKGLDRFFSTFKCEQSDPQES